MFKLIFVFVIFGSLSYGQEIIGEPVLVINPCPELDSICIKNYFAQNSNCRISSGAVPDPLYQEHLYLSFPVANLTIDSFGINISGLEEGRITTLYVNLETEVTVVAITFPNIQTSVQRDVYSYFRNGLEPLVTVESSQNSYPEMTLTTVFRGINNLRLENSFTSGYMSGVFESTTSPPSSAYNNTPFAAAFQDISDYSNIYSRELIQQRARYFNVNFIQYAICNFGLID